MAGELPDSATAHHVEVRWHERGSATILIDGLPVQDTVRAFTVTVGAPEQLPTVQLSLIPAGMVFDGRGLVDVTPLTRDLLVSLGWTSPKSARGE